MNSSELGRIVLPLNRNQTAEIAPAMYKLLKDIMFLQAKVFAFSSQIYTPLTFVDTVYQKQGLWLTIPVGAAALGGFCSFALNKLAQQYPEDKTIKSLCAKMKHLETGVSIIGNIGFIESMLNIIVTQLLATSSPYYKTAAIPAIMAGATALSVISEYGNRQQYVPRSITNVFSNIIDGGKCTAGMTGPFVQYGYIKGNWPVGLIGLATTVGLSTSTFKELVPATKSPELKSTFIDMSFYTKLLVAVLLNGSLAISAFNLLMSLYTAVGMEINDIDNANDYAGIPNFVFFGTLAYAGAMALVLSGITVQSAVSAKNSQQTPVQREEQQKLVEVASSSYRTLEDEQADSNDDENTVSRCFGC